MGHIIKTPAGTYRANWRDPAGRQKAKTFPTRKQAAAYLAETETTVTRGTYVNPHAGRIRFEVYARKWGAGRNDEAMTTARDASVMRARVLPTWGTVPIGRIDHSAVQAWASELGKQLAPATVRECCRLLKAVLTLAVRDRVIGQNPAEGIRLPKRRRTDADEQVITREAFASNLLPEIPERYRALVALAGGTGLRWGECIGLTWDAIDLDAGTVRVSRVAIEVAGNVTFKPYPKSRAGRRVVPLPPFVVRLLRKHANAVPPGPAGEVFTNEAGGPMRRTVFRAWIWRPALVRAGLLGKVVQVDVKRWRATWRDRQGNEVTEEFPNRRVARARVSRSAQGGLRFHDLRHSYATWLISDGVPLNDVARVMGHEQISTTLDRYTHAFDAGAEKVRESFADFPLTFEADESETGD
ncbi:site-specific integrase [Micromonospora sp. CPCC 206060]|uniref:tyrosine-type recombinase/integrase n=1 Tax=Micromonospora sp. CPCC 206060 TaxID=3122406 RepID=UPI002FEF9C9E